MNNLPQKCIGCKAWSKSDNPAPVDFILRNYSTENSTGTQAVLRFLVVFLNNSTKVTGDYLERRVENFVVREKN
jgi:hypothetical protein